MKSCAFSLSPHFLSHMSHWPIQGGYYFQVSGLLQSQGVLRKIINWFCFVLSAALGNMTSLRELEL